MNRNLVHDNESTFYAVSLILSILTYLVLILSVVGIFYIAIGFIIAFFMRGLYIANYRNNGVKLSQHQFPDINERVVDMCRKMDIQQIPDVFIIEQEGALNAFASRFFGRNFVVLYSDIFELVDRSREELDFVIAHELAHIQRNHMTKDMLLFPALWVPFLGKAYSRACEYTCDRIAAAQIGNPNAAVNALTILAVGKELYKQVNVSDFLYQHDQETGFFVWFSHMLSTHPPLPERIKEVDRFFGQHAVNSGVTQSL